MEEVNPQELLSALYDDMKYKFIKQKEKIHRLLYDIRKCKIKYKELRDSKLEEYLVTSDGRDYVRRDKYEQVKKELKLYKNLYNEEIRIKERIKIGI
jgi:hypothetical protein